MKKFMLVLVAFVLPAGLAFAQRFPTSGQWRLQVLGTEKEFIVEIKDTTWIFDIDGNELPQIVTINNGKKTIVIPLLTAVADYYFFEIKSGYIDLRAGGKFNLPLLESMRSGMVNMQGINDVTDDFVEKIIVEIEAAFYKVPIMRLSRIN